MAFNLEPTEIGFFLRVTTFVREGDKKIPVLDGSGRP